MWLGVLEVRDVRNLREVKVDLDPFCGPHAKTVRALVGNGGLSLRRIRKCQALLREFPQALEMFRRTGTSHLLAASGMNVALLIGIFAFLARQLGVGPWRFAPALRRCTGARAPTDARPSGLPRMRCAYPGYLVAR